MTALLEYFNLLWLIMEAEKGREAYAPCTPLGSTPGLSKLLYNYCIASISVYVLTICIVGLASGGVRLLPLDPPLQYIKQSYRMKLSTIATYVTLSANIHVFYTSTNFFYIFFEVGIQISYQVNSFEALNSRGSMKIDLYSNYIYRK